jgi:hypothetical protein
MKSHIYSDPFQERTSNTQTFFWGEGEAGGVWDGEPIPLAARSKAWVYGRSLAGIVGSNPT